MLPIKIHVTPPGPNPWKVIQIMEELSIPYEINCFAHAVVKKEPFISINPNGRVPAIEDPNTGLTLWESAAIIMYLIDTYDKDHIISHADPLLRALEHQYLTFQVSTQGPYFGQAGWFHVLHPEKIDSAKERYKGEVQRILGVLEKCLEGKQWLVGDKMTYADLSFASWNDRIDALCPPMKPEDKFKGFPGVEKWQERMVSRPSWKTTMDKREVLMNEQALNNNTGMPHGFKTLAEYEEHLRKEAESKG